MKYQPINSFFKTLLALTILISLPQIGFPQKLNYVPKKKVLNAINRNIEDATIQYKILKNTIPKNKLPRTFENGKLITSNSDWWCSGFYPGTLFYLFELTKDTVLKIEGLRNLILLEKEQYNKGTHDLGFMINNSFGIANQLFPNKSYQNILITSAQSLASRFDAKVGCIRSWNNKKPGDFLVIIDNMMNLELLFNATKLSGDSTYYKIAVKHANTTMNNHFRLDYSSYHVLEYNTETGKPMLKRTDQGFGNESAWARGQAWGLYGFTMMYAETKNKKYLDFANRIASFIITNPNLPADQIPYWDFDAPKSPQTYRDASAAAIIASALIELANFNKPSLATKYLTVAEKIILQLSTSQYKNINGQNGGFLLKHSVGSLPHNSEVDVPLTYADYYYVEAMRRYLNLQ
ncbi:Glycosyl Hydrolase Family 88 [Pedobacter sp. ok626]|uniref:glycoside hydrolase family 88 protein n=1 Tax=Pedobacter sp. ok626 TaxID=1761882 RepID=UPI0008883B50|nr:glycoside hydrolase family 88 protein [Pedobacter sp. ok626]SDJ90484.1 Glycosyl Hydrolase Family 88 [Pedobacter sp. ok626]